jgi:hypothetical protein
MSEPTRSESPFAQKLRSIHERMRNVSEAEVQLAISLASAETTRLTRGAMVAHNYATSFGQKPHRAAPELTRTASPATQQL